MRCCSSSEAATTFVRRCSVLEVMTRTRALLDDIEPATETDAQRLAIARELAADINRYDQLLAASKKRITRAVTASGTSLTEVQGCGPICAAMIIGHTAPSPGSPPGTTSPPTTRPRRSKRPRATGSVTG